MNLFIHVHIEGPLHKGQGHLQGFRPQRGAVIGNELQPLDAHQPTVAGRVLLQILKSGRREWTEAGQGGTPDPKSWRVSQEQDPDTDPSAVSEKPYTHGKNDEVFGRQPDGSPVLAKATWREPGRGPPG